MKIPNSLRAVSALFLATCLGAPFSASANTIGSFSNNSLFNLLVGNPYYSEARAALLADGHTLVDLSVGSLTANLASVDVAYLSWSNSPSYLTNTQITAFASYLSNGGTLIVQADHNAYDDLLAVFGVTVGGAAFGGTQSIVQSYAPLTAGIHGNVTTTNVAAAFQLGVPTGGLILDSANTVAVLGSGFGFGSGVSGKLVVFGEVNMFDGADNYNGLNKANNKALWRNAFEMGSSSASVPESSTTLILIGGGCLMLAMVRRRMAVKAE